MCRHLVGEHQSNDVDKIRKIENRKKRKKEVVSVYWNCLLSLSKTHIHLTAGRLLLEMRRRKKEIGRKENESRKTSIDSGIFEKKRTKKKKEKEKSTFPRRNNNIVDEMGHNNNDYSL